MHISDGKNDAATHQTIDDLIRLIEQSLEDLKKPQEVADRRKTLAAVSGLLKQIDQLNRVDRS